MSDDPTDWFRPRGEDRKRPDDPSGGQESGERRPTDDPPATERLDAVDPADAEPPTTQPLGPEDTPGADPQSGAASPATAGDGLSNLFGEQRDYSRESDWLPPRDGATDEPTAVQPTAPASDPLDWLGDRTTDDATTVAFGSAAGGRGAPAPGRTPDAAVTQRFDAAGYPPTGSTTAGGPPPEEGGSRKLVIALAVIGGVLVIALVIALIWLFAGGGPASPTPSPTDSATTSRTPKPTPTKTSASPTPSVTPTAEPTPTAAPPAPAPTIGSFSASPSAPACTAPTGTVNLSFSWATSNAAKVSLSIDGVADPYNDQLTGSGTLSGVPYDCSKASQGYTLIATGSSGRQTSKPLTLTRPTIDDGGGDTGGDGLDND